MMMFREMLRVVTAVIFMVSGLVKAIDPVGFSFKLEEYFSPAVFNLEFFIPYALLIAVFVVILELVLGLFLLLKVKLKFTLGFLISLCIFFGFLTFYSAYYNVVTDCGCFGDAVKFTPWQSFIKDIVLLIALVFLWKNYQNSEEFHRNLSLKQLGIFIFAIFSLAMVIKTGIYHEPIVDFRDYKVGVNLRTEKEKIAQNPSEYKIIYTLKNQKTGEEIEANQDEYIEKNYWENTDWEILSDKTKSVVSKQGYVSSIDKFKIENTEGNDITDSLLNSPKTILVFAYHPEKVPSDVLNQIEEKLIANKEKALIYGVSSQPNTFKKLPNAVMDATAIKTIARSNPFVLVLSKATIIEKMSAEDFIKNE